MNKALQDLIDLGQGNKDVKAFGKVWSMHTLDTQELLDATNTISDYDQMARFLALKVAVLSRAIDTVDGEPVGNATEAHDLFSRLQIQVINTVYDEYEKMSNEQDDKLNKLSEEQKKDSDNETKDGSKDANKDANKEGPKETQAKTE